MGGGKNTRARPDLVGTSSVKGDHDTLERGRHNCGQMGPNRPGGHVPMDTNGDRGDEQRPKE